MNYFKNDSRGYPSQFQPYSLPKVYSVESEKYYHLKESLSKYKELASIEPRFIDYAPQSDMSADGENGITSETISYKRLAIENYPGIDVKINQIPQSETLQDNSAYMESSISSLATQDVMLMERTNHTKPELFTACLQNSICLSNNSEPIQYHTQVLDSLSGSMHSNTSLSESELVLKSANPSNIQSSSNFWLKIDNIERKIARIDESLLKIVSQLETSNIVINDNRLDWQSSSTPKAKSPSQIAANTRDIKELAALLDSLNGKVCSLADKVESNKKEKEKISKDLSNLKGESVLLAEQS